MPNIESIIFYLILIDAIGANITTWFFPKWYMKNSGKFYKHFPVSKGWAALYLILILWVGYSLMRVGIL